MMIANIASVNAVSLSLLIFQQPLSSSHRQVVAQLIEHIHKNLIDDALFLVYRLSDKFRYSASYADCIMALQSRTWGRFWVHEIHVGWESSCLPAVSVLKKANQAVSDDTGANRLDWYSISPERTPA